jgi:hypothetical protein
LPVPRGFIVLREKNLEVGTTFALFGSEVKEWVQDRALGRRPCPLSGKKLSGGNRLDEILTVKDP